MSIPPSYVRSANVLNQTGNDVTVEAVFKSKYVQSYGPVPLGQTVHVEHEINMGTWTAVDPVEVLTAFGPDNSLLAVKTLGDAIGVQELNFTLKVQFSDN